MDSLCPSHCLDRSALIEASTKGTKAFNAVEVLLKGFECELPAGISFHDKDGNPRTAVRLQWWKQNASKLAEVVLHIGLDIGGAAEALIPLNVPRYSSSQSPCFIGHYWLKGEPSPLASNVACLDYSAAKQGKRVAYRWDGEQKLTQSKFTYAAKKAE